MNKTFHANRIHFNACVGFNGDFDIDTYAFGYLESVQILMQSTIKGKVTLDAIVYPILYSARHYIELTLKHQLSLLTLINQAVDSKFSYRIITSHSISWLWNEFKELSKIDNRYLPLIQESNEFIDDFSEIDDTGETFRYPYSTDNNKYLGHLHCIDLIDFNSRFKLLSEKLKEIGFLSSLLVEEYKQRSFLCNKSRSEIENIAKELPPITTWHNENFKLIKDTIKNEFSLSSNQLSRIISFIKSHREFSALIDNEIQIKELNINDLKWFLFQYDEFLRNRTHKKYFEHLQEITNKMCQKLTKKAIASISQLYDMGYFRLYSEEYDKGLKYKMKETKSELIRVYLFGNGIVKEKIKLGLQSMGQKTLLQAFN
jgi:hypothetical protein